MLGHEGGKKKPLKQPSSILRRWMRRIRHSGRKRTRSKRN